MDHTDWEDASPISSESFRNTLLNRPPVRTKNLQFLLIHDEHNAIVGGTSMTDLFWTGALWYFNDISELDRKKAAITQELDTGVCDAVYLNENKFVVVDDSGAVQIFDIMTDNSPEQPAQFLSVAYACQHDSSALTVSLFPDKKNIITAGMDYCIKVWDLEELIATHTFHYAHTDIVTSVDVKPTCNHIAASAGLDGESLLWDVRCSKAVQVLYSKSGSQLTAVTWNTNVDHLVAIGAEDGTVMLVDVRRTDVESPDVWTKCDRGVHKLLFNPNPEKKDQLACCFNNTTVNVFDSYRELLEIYKDDGHSDFVRGLAWHKDDLFSCSWDGTVNKHVISSDDDTKSDKNNGD
ncbi:hypothetical protein DMN91_006316 [Ooceraea biroi]|uniref:Methylosome protein n=1 Tax=Ooceraea biroi TaxID=2015173 RepID=A0A026W1Z7_OOCBI|nr:methylosome protein 50 [Ooceraea biroi]XP_011345596.1 methylosome protein 50 [Ooceraea biroi]XP_011345597.1 methylosome protein 50 [Ooceraea biroi]EZA50092.1 Methylosome protein [Ooceraea biroi]RLU21937.1 hypothetical protein DMN91_006316 [Ooceraea biroi]